MGRGRVWALAAVFCVMAVGSWPAQAQAERRFKSLLKKEQEPPDRKLSVTGDVFLLLSPVLKLTGELRMGKDWSVAGVAGGGNAAQLDVFGGQEVEVEASVLMAGAQLRGYLFGDFDRGMVYGVQLMGVVRTTPGAPVEDMGSGMSIAPFFGYKRVLENGFTSDWLLGVEEYVTQVEGGGFANTVVMFNLNFGWSFGGDA